MHIFPKLSNFEIEIICETDAGWLFHKFEIGQLPIFLKVVCHWIYFFTDGMFWIWNIQLEYSWRVVDWTKDTVWIYFSYFAVGISKTVWKTCATKCWNIGQLSLASFDQRVHGTWSRLFHGCSSCWSASPMRLAVHRGVMTSAPQVCYLFFSTRCANFYLLVWFISGRLVESIAGMGPSQYRDVLLV